MFQKKLMLLFCIFYYFIPCKGHNSNDSDIISKGNRYSVGFSIGVSLPVDGFGSTSSFQHTEFQQDTIHGFANNGFHFDLTPRFYVSSWFGIDGLIAGNFNSYNTTAYNNNIDYSENRISSTSAGTYYSGAYMFGVFFCLPSSPSFYVGIMGGDISLSCPTITTSFSASPTQAAGEESFSATTASSFGWCLNCGVDCNINKKIFITGNVSYSFATMHYSNAIVTQTLQGSPTLSVNLSNPVMTFGIVQPTVGVGYRF